MLDGGTAGFGDSAAGFEWQRERRQHLEEADAGEIVWKGSSSIGRQSIRFLTVVLHEL